MLHRLTNEFNLKTAKPIATTDSVTTCLCCGKSNLKKTVVLEDAENNFSFYGVDCASKAGIKSKGKGLTRRNTPLNKVIFGNFNKGNIIKEAYIVEYYKGNVELFIKYQNVFEVVSTKLHVVRLLNDFKVSLSLLEYIPALKDIYGIS